MDFAVVTCERGKIVHYNDIAQTYFRAPFYEMVGTPIDVYLRGGRFEDIISYPTPLQPHYNGHVFFAGLDAPVAVRTYRGKGYYIIVAGGTQVSEELLVDREERRWAERLQIMLFGVSHELKTPIAIARGYVGMLEGSEAQRALEALDRVSAILNSMTNTVQEFQQENEDVDLGRGIESFYDTALYAEPAKRYIGTIDVDVAAAEGKRVRMAKTRLYQIFTNLFDNSVRATQGLETGARVEIRARLCDKPHHASCVVIEFSDNGCGMDAETVERVFTPYFTTWRPKRGTGMGGYFIHRYVLEAGGSIEVASNKGGGTKFKIHLPYK